MCSLLKEGRGIGKEMPRGYVSNLQKRSITMWKGGEGKDQKVEIAIISMDKD